MNDTTFGQRGGEGPNTKKRASTYEATLPDGKITHKKSYNVHSEIALIGCYQHDGRWQVAGVYAVDAPKVDGQTFIEAKKMAE